MPDTKPAEPRVDLAVFFVDGKAVLGIVIEVQLSTDDDKRRRWPAYVVCLRDRLGCPACVLVVPTGRR